MNQRNEKEIDLLLRRHARRGAKDFANTQGAGDDGARDTLGAHLDADELSAYAENALPPRTRARYAGHLADCADCRKLVTRLALSANVPLKEESEAGLKKIERKSWGEWLAALFASPALRFGTLALLLLGVAGAALIVMQQRNREERGLIAQNTKPKVAVEEPPSMNHANSSAEERSATDTENANVSADSVSSTSASAASTPNQPASQAVSGRMEDDSRRLDAPSNKAQPTAVPGVVAGSISPPISEQRETERAENRPAAAPPSQTQPALSAGATVSQDEELRARRGEEAQRQEENARARGGSAAATGTAQQPGRTAEAPAPAQDRTQPNAIAGTRRRAERTENEVALSDSTKNSAGANETRRVAGHQFRRQGSVWVDTAYSSSMSTTNARRGSERYHSLVADAPEIRTIAEQLSGEIIVVWNGKAYRIK